MDVFMNLLYTCSTLTVHTCILLKIYRIYSAIQLYFIIHLLKQDCLWKYNKYQAYSKVMEIKSVSDLKDSWQEVKVINIFTILKNYFFSVMRGL